MRKFMCLVLAALVLFTVTGCSQVQANPEKIELMGCWRQSNGSSDSYQAAVITADGINIYWVSDGGRYSVALLVGINRSSRS